MGMLIALTWEFGSLKRTMRREKYGDPIVAILLGRIEKVRDRNINFILPQVHQELYGYVWVAQY
jgi:hypothetical protein